MKILNRICSSCLDNIEVDHSIKCRTRENQDDKVFISIYYE